MSRIVKTYVFVDWDSARRIVRPKITRKKTSIGLESLLKIQDNIAETLNDRHGAVKHRIKMRLYHGWHRGKTPTEDRREIENIKNDPHLSRNVKNCWFSGVELGDELLCGGTYATIFDTLRSQKSGEISQKMVDTSLVCDLLNTAKIDRNGISVVMGDDDDLIPGVITADAWGHKTILKRVFRIHESHHINISSLLA